MAPPKLLGLIALAFITFVALSSLPVTALVADRAQVARHVHAHNAAARRKRKRTDPSTPTSNQCIPGPSSPASSLSTSTSTSTSTTPLPSSTTSAASTTSSGSWGLAWGADDSFLPNFNFPNIQFLYTWSPYLPTNLPSQVSGAAMLWGYDQTSQFQQLVVPGYAKYAMGVNEPNVPSQSNMSPQNAVDLWMQYLEPLAAEGYILISPACTSDDTGTTWYQSFFQLCAACTIDRVAFHSYNTDPQVTIDYATMLYNTYKKPIWLTEFGDQDFSSSNQATMDEVWAYAGTIKSFVDSTSWIEAAFPFGVMTSLPDGVNSDNILMQPDGTPTDLAKFYFS